MEPNNFEKDFREKLNKHTIEPSEKAWDRLDAILSIAEEKQPKKNNKRWLYIAASIVGFLLVGTFFFNQKKTVTETPKANVVSEDNINKDSVTQPTLNIDTSKTEVAISGKESIQNANKKEKKINHNDSEQKLDESIKNQKSQIAESSVIIKNNQEKQSINNQTSVVETSKNESVDQLLITAEKNSCCRTFG